MSESQELDPRIAALLHSGGTKLPSPIEKTLDLEALPVHEIVVEPREDRDDYQTAREGVHRALSKAETAVDELMAIARVSQHPRGYEVLNQLLNTMLAANKELVDLKKKDLDMNDTGDRGPSVVNNTLILTPMELLQKLKDAKDSVV